MIFDAIAILDWSAAGTPKRGKDSIWLGLARATGAEAENLPTRTAAETRLQALVAAALAQGHRLLIGADFAFGYPQGFAAALTGQPRALAVWDWLARHVTEGPRNASNHRDVAARINACFPGEGPLWFNAGKADIAGLPRRKPALPPGLTTHRLTDLAARGGGASPKPVWQLGGAGAVGAQVLTGLPALHRLRAAFPGRVAVWPFEPATAAPVVLAEVYPSMLAAEVRRWRDANRDRVADEAQVRLLAAALWRLCDQRRLAPLFQPGADPDRLTEEGWILGAGHQTALRGGT